jgi:hypothetical protein
MDKKKLDTLKHFIKFCKQELNIQSLPYISLINDKSFVEERRSFGEYNPSVNSVKVVALNRNLADICRSLAHELTHHRQWELGLINPGSGDTGSEIENDANAMAGIIMREYGKLNLSVYDIDSLSTLQNLAEAKQVGVLYHFTNYPSLVGIIKSNFKLTSNIQSYVSFTRNKRMQSDTVSQSVRITIDGDKLSNKYKFEPYADAKAGYGRSSTDESEERVSLERYPEGVDISKAIKSIEIKKPSATYSSGFDDEEGFEPPSLLAYEEVLKTLNAKNIEFKLVDQFK